MAKMPIRKVMAIILKIFFIISYQLLSYMSSNCKLCGRSKQGKRLCTGGINRFVIKYPCKGKRPVLTIVVQGKPTDTRRISP